MGRWRSGWLDGDSALRAAVARAERLLDATCAEEGESCLNS